MKESNHLKDLGVRLARDMHPRRASNEKYWWCVQTELPKRISRCFRDERVEVISLDPGVYTFTTAFSTDDRAHNIGGSDDLQQLCRIGHIIDKNLKNIEQLYPEKKEASETEPTPKHKKGETKSVQR